MGAVDLDEAFAVQSLICLDTWGIDPAILNTRGGAITFGHPSVPPEVAFFGTLAKVLRADRHRWGVATLYIGVGQGLAVLENMQVVRPGTERPSPNWSCAPSTGQLAAR